METKFPNRRQFFLQSVATIGSMGVASRTGRGERSEVSVMQYVEYVGLPISEVPTPALLVDLDIFEANLATMARACADRRTQYRPHGKAHKSSLVAKKQLAAGADGLCAGKLGEAEVFVAAGIRDILITTEVVGRRKIGRLVGLARASPEVKVVVDNAENVADLASAAAAEKVRLAVLVDVNVGQNRTGVDTPEEASDLAQLAARQPSLHFMGVQAYAGNNMHIVGFDNRRAASLRALERAVAAAEAIKRAGLPVAILSVGGTGTYNIDTGFPGVTEIQPGSYIFMDSHYRSIGNEMSEVFSDFGNSLSVLTTVISRPSKGRAITDGGNKALSSDAGPPALKDGRGVSYQAGGDEHGVLLLRDPNREFKPGDKVEFVPSHCDTTVNLHNVFFAIRKGTVEAVWPIEARGRVD
jgi:D-serine deaminase-like pyridoxal phosphate-dependent protein